MLITKSLIYSMKNNPDRLAILEEGHQYTYAELGMRTAKLKEGIKKMGVKKGDRVGILLFNTFRFLELLYAITAIGAIAVPLNTRLSLNEMEEIILDSELKVLFLHPEFLQHIPYFQNNTLIDEYIYVGDKEIGSEYLNYEEIIANESVTELTYDKITENDVAFIFYTGGTTGSAKGVMLTHRNQVSNFYHTCNIFKYHEWTNYLHAGPMFHLADCGKSIGVTYLGGTHSFIKKFTPKGFLEKVEKYRPTVVSLIPTMINMIINESSFKNYDVSSIQKLNYGSSSMPLNLLNTIKREFPQVELFQSYGMTEASPVLTILEPKDHVINGNEESMKRLSSVGKSVPGVEVRVVGETGCDVKVGEVGEIIARGQNIMKGYWQSPEKTREVVRDGWYHSGDMAMVDEEGYIYIVDRKKDMVITGGENVYSIEVENVISNHPGVLETAVIGVPDPKWGEAIKAIVVLKKGIELSEQDLIKFGSHRLANYKVPKSIDFIDKLPKSGVGKVLKAELRKKYWGNLSENIN